MHNRALKSQISVTAACADVFSTEISSELAFLDISTGLQRGSHAPQSHHRDQPPSAIHGPSYDTADFREKSALGYLGIGCQVP